MRRDRSALLSLPSSPHGSEVSTFTTAEDAAKQPVTVRKLVVIAVGVALVVVYWPLMMRWLGRLGWLVTFVVVNIVVRVWAPEVIGVVMSTLVSQIALFGEVDLSFSGVRIVPWIELGQARQSEDDEPLLARPRARFIDIEGHEVNESLSSLSSLGHSLFGSNVLGQSGGVREKLGHMMKYGLRGVEHKEKPELRRERSQSSEAETSFKSNDGSTTPSSFDASRTDDGSNEDTGCVWRTERAKAVPWWRRFIEQTRLCVEVRCRKFTMGNPRNSADWCRDRFVTGTDIEVTLSMTLSDLFQLAYLTTYWSWRPRDQPIRPSDDGGKLPFGACRDLKTHTVRNRVMLGVIDIEKFDICDAEVAFEQCDGLLNCAAIGSALARGEVKFAAWKGNEAAGICHRHKPNWLHVDVYAARDLDKAMRTSRLGLQSSSRHAPSPFARIQARGQMRQSRTIMVNAAPVFGYEPEPFVVTDPSTVVHIVIFDEARFGDNILGQFATTLKQLVLDSSAVDGGLGLQATAYEPQADHGGNEDDRDNGGTPYLEWRGWVPLRDAKWRRFVVPTFQLPERGCGARINYGSGDDIDEETTPDSSLREEPLHGYPAVMVKIRWERVEDVANMDKISVHTALEHMKYNSAETAARCGNIENVRAMLATFPFWLDWRGGFKIRGRATAHIRDLFLGNEGDLERKRRRRPNNQLTNSDWRDAVKKAVSLSRLEVAFPTTPEEHRHRYKVVWAPQRRAFVPSVEERRGFLTLDTALSRLVKGLIERVLASGRVGASLGHIVSAVSAGALIQPHTMMRQSANGRASDASDDAIDSDKKLSTFELAKKTARASRVPYGALRGYRSDRQFALLLGFVRHSHKRMDAHAIEDVSKPVRAAGILLKTSKPPGRRRHWKPYRCVLRGALRSC